MPWTLGIWFRVRLGSMKGHWVSVLIKDGSRILMVGHVLSSKWVPRMWRNGWSPRVNWVEPFMDVVKRSMKSGWRQGQMAAKRVVCIW